LNRQLELVGDWAPTVGRWLLALVLGWFGVHELQHPQLWTGYVPGVSATSSAAAALVVVHGWLLSVLAVALAVGVLPRLAAAVAGVLLLEIVLGLLFMHGLSDTSMRDFGVLGLAVMVAGSSRQRWTLRR
jgi:uncharacterized membrane protein YphA (DoxX/SURF4 family)